MSSTLDDMESYEFFQTDLDGWLGEFLKIHTVTRGEELLLHSYIEYACFFRLFENASQLNEENLIDFFQFARERGLVESHESEILVKDFLYYIRQKSGL